MTNEEKARIEANTYLENCMENNLQTTVSEDFINGFLAGAEWKDHQFKEYLEKKKSDIEQGILHSNPFIDCDRWCGRADIINEIINELFGE